MRTLLINIFLLVGFLADLSAQKDFVTLDKRSYDYYLKGDYLNLKKTADTMFSQGIDYYYLRMRLGILAWDKRRYGSAAKQFKKAIEFNSLDTISREYLYKSYLFSGRTSDAEHYSELITKGRNIPGRHPSSEFSIGTSASVSDITLYQFNNLFYEAIKSTLNINAGFEKYLSKGFKGTFAFFNQRKAGTVYSGSFPRGTNLNFTQNQVYARLSYNILPGWELSGFGDLIFFSGGISHAHTGTGGSLNQINTEFLGGLGISKYGWRLRTGANISFSNFGFSKQFRGEAFLTLLPFGNLNLYLTSGWMGQNDTNWGGTYQVSQEIGFKITSLLWLESGIVSGNSFLFAGNQGYFLNNSFQVPSTSLYANIIILPGKRFNMTITPFYTENKNYSWDLSAFRRNGELSHSTFGGSIKLIFKN